MHTDDELMNQQTHIGVQDLVQEGAGNHSSTLDSMDTQAVALNPTIIRRACDPIVLCTAEQAGYTPLQARILAARLLVGLSADLRSHVSPSLKQLDAPDSLPDIQIAARLIADAVMDEKQMVILLSDHDVDGGGANAVLHIALTDHFGMDPRRVGSVLSHKRKEGFGVSEALLERLVTEYPPPALVITLDQGSQDQDRFATMHAMGYRIIVTDHHHIGQVPSSVEACVNPTRDDSQFADPLICGNAVGWLVACATRRELIQRGHLPANAPSLACVLDIVAASVMADAVSLARSVNNRAVIRYGLKRMNEHPRPAWRAMRSIMRKEGPFTESDLSMAIGPRLNAISRMGEALPIVQFLLAKDDETALALAKHAETQNQERKQAERAMLEQAMALAAPQAKAGRHAICVHLPEGNSAIHGITSSRLTEAFGRPAICLSPQFGSVDELTGSLRSIPDINILDALTEASRIDPGCLIKFGGHSGAGGVRLHAGNVQRLADAFDKAVAMQRDLSDAMPLLWSDGELDRTPDAGLLDELAAIGPFGREFEAPMFEADVQALAVRTMGDGSHLRADLKNARGEIFSAVWFGAIKNGATVPLTVGRCYHLLFGVTGNVYRSQRRVELQIKHATAME